MLALPHRHLHLLVGETPPQDQLRQCGFEAFGAQEFAQVVFLQSANLVQLCNFVRRCRKEGAKRPYLVFLHFKPHRETWHLIEKASVLNLSLVLVSRGRGVLELFSHRPYSVWEWMQGRGMCFRSRDAAWSTNPALLKTWSERSAGYFVEPHKHFTSLASAFPTSGPSQANTHQTPPQQGTGSATMTIPRACELLQISPTAWNNKALITKSYRRLALALHPDKQRHNPRAAHDFALLSEARALLLSQCS